MKNKDEIVIYKNEFNAIPLRNFTSVEMDLLFTIMSQMRDKGLNEIEFGFSDLKHLSKYNKENAIKSFVEDLEKTYDKLLQLNVKIGTTGEFTKFVFFTKYSISEKNQIIRIGVNSEFIPLINEITGNFTKFELEEIVSLNSSYSKSCYKLLKQFRLTGFLKMDIERFRYLMDIPESYKMGNIDQKVLKPIMRELPEYFKELKITKVRGNGKDKRRIAAITFKFEPQSDINKQGYKTFRDKETGEFKEKHLYNFTDEDIEKALPEIEGQLLLELGQ